MRLSMATLVAGLTVLACSSKAPPPPTAAPAPAPVADAGPVGLGAVYYFYLGPLGDVRYVYAPGDTWKSGVIGGSGTTSKPAVVKNPDGTVYVVVTGPRGDVLLSRSKTAVFPEWTSLGFVADNLTTGAYFDLPGVAVNADGRVELFLVGREGKVHHSVERARDTGDFVQWSLLDDASSPSWPAHPVAARNMDGRLELFLVAGTGTLFHKWQETPSSSDWSNELRWESMSRPGAAHLLPGTLAVGTLDDGRLEVFVEGSNTGARAVHLFHLWQTVLGGGWSGWENLHLTASLPSRPAVALDRFGTEGYQYLFVQQGRSLLYKRQLVTNGRWGEWNPLEGTWLAAVSVLRAPDGLYLFESKGAVGYYNKSALNSPDAGTQEDGGSPQEYPGQGWPSGWKQLY
jgi:hypothetical protein